MDNRIRGGFHRLPISPRVVRDLVSLLLLSARIIGEERFLFLIGERKEKEERKIQVHSVRSACPPVDVIFHVKELCSKITVVEPGRQRRETCSLNVSGAGNTVYSTLFSLVQTRKSVGFAMCRKPGTQRASAAGL